MLAMMQRIALGLGVVLLVGAALWAAPQDPPVEVRTTGPVTVEQAPSAPAAHGHEAPPSDTWSMLFVLLLATFIGLGVILRVSRLLHTPLMSLTNAISAIAVVGAILVTGPDYPLGIRILGAIAVFASMTNIVSGFLITDRMLRMFKQTRTEVKP
jgi:H+-translocating NAD(P) transhydrogenase subunit alpha